MSSDTSGWSLPRRGKITKTRRAEGDTFERSWRATKPCRWGKLENRTTVTINAVHGMRLIRNY